MSKNGCVHATPKNVHGKNSKIRLARESKAPEQEEQVVIIDMILYDDGLYIPAQRVLNRNLQTRQPPRVKLRMAPHPRPMVLIKGIL